MTKLRQNLLSRQMLTAFGVSLATAGAVPALSPPAHAAEEPDHVVIGLDEFLQLYEQSREPDPERPLPPFDHATNRVALRGEVVSEDGRPVAAVFSATVHVDVLAPEGWVQIPVLPLSAALRHARALGRDVPVGNNGIQHTILWDKRGPLELQLEFAVPVSESQGTASLYLDLPPAAAAELSLAVPSADLLDFSVGGASLLRQRDESGRRIVEATLPPGQPLSVQWQRALPEVEAERPRVQAELFTLAGFGDGLLSARTTVQYAISQGEVRSFRLRVPADVTVVDVQGSGLRQWRIGEDRVLQVDLNFAAEHSYALTLFVERPAPPDGSSRDLPLPLPLDVERSKGWAAVEARGALEVGSLEVAHAVPLDVRTLPPQISGLSSQPLLFGWKYLGDSARIPLVATAHGDVAVLVTLLDEARATTMVTREGRRLTQLQLQVRNHGRQFLRVKLPAGAELWSATVAGQATQPGQTQDGTLLLPLLRSQESSGALAAYAVAVVYVEDGTAAREGHTLKIETSLPELDVPISWVCWSLWVPSEARFRKKDVAGNLRRVGSPSRPWTAGDMNTIQTVASPAAGAVMDETGAQLAHGALGYGAAPVLVSVPVQGRPVHFERLLALGERLWVGMELKRVE